MSALNYMVPITGAVMLCLAITRPTRPTGFNYRIEMLNDEIKREKYQKKLRNLEIKRDEYQKQIYNLDKNDKEYSI
jgi:hypothetical protein